MGQDIGRACEGAGMALYQHLIPSLYAPTYRVAPKLPYNDKYCTYPLSIEHPRFYASKLISVEINRR